MSQKRRVLITGARWGIGYATAQRLNDDGYWVTAIDLYKPEVEIPGVDFHTCDLTDTATTRALIESLADECPFYALINNAAITHYTSVYDVTIEEMRMACELHLIAPVICTQAVLPGMESLGGGRIVNISSRAALGKENRTAYSATKAGVVGMSRTWALELAPKAITVNVVAPGLIETESTPATGPEAAASIAAVPLGRFGTTAEISHAIEFLLDDGGAFITGQTLYVDGGRTIAVSMS